MDKNFFKKIRILDGGMGQELLHKGLKPKGTLWSAHAQTIKFLLALILYEEALGPYPHLEFLFF